MNMICGKCNKEYGLCETLKLVKVKVVESDTDPMNQHGFTSVCECGYAFFKDRWQLKNIVSIFNGAENVDVEVSTVYLEIGHGMNEDLFYETMLFSDEKISDFMKRYKTKEEAEKGHNEIVSFLTDGKFKIEDERLLLGE
jgi:hypothetical protein